MTISHKIKLKQKTKQTIDTTHNTCKMRLRSGRTISNKTSLGLQDTLTNCIQKYEDTKNMYYVPSLRNHQSLDYYTEMPYVVLHLYSAVNKFFDIIYNNYEYEHFHEIMYSICDKGLRYLDSIPPKEDMSLEAIGLSPPEMRRLSMSVNEIITFMDKISNY